jgi:hypothetical protein
LGKSINTVYSNLLVDTGPGATSHIINDKSKFIAFDGNFDSIAYFRTFLVWSPSPPPHFLG